jgi:hypothetical protein
MSTVVIVSDQHDPHSISVRDTLNEHYRLSAFILNMRDFPGAASCSFRNDPPNRRYLDAQGNVIYFNEIRSIWWRRPTPSLSPRLFFGIDHGNFVQAECDHFLQGMLWGCSCLWVNDPARHLMASRKVVQLLCAEHVGFHIPKTIITNNPREVREFVAVKQSRIVFKRVGTSPGPASKTTFLTPEVLDNLDSIIVCPTTFQEYIEARADVRVIWINGSHWAFYIDSQSGESPEDCRFDLTVAHTPYKLPEFMEKQLDILMTQLAGCGKNRLTERSVGLQCEMLA